ncbi:hypothetical protein P7C70_g929, partial [Phenoliferia sp. Uapishka_3]
LAPAPFLLPSSSATISSSPHPIVGISTAPATHIVVPPISALSLTQATQHRYQLEHYPHLLTSFLAKRTHLLAVHKYVSNVLLFLKTLPSTSLTQLNLPDPPNIDPATLVKPEVFPKVLIEGLGAEETKQVYGRLFQAWKEETEWHDLLTRWKDKTKPAISKLKAEQTGKKEGVMVVQSQDGVALMKKKKRKVAATQGEFLMTQGSATPTPFSTTGRLRRSPRKATTSTSTSTSISASHPPPPLPSKSFTNPKAILPLSGTVPRRTSPRKTASQLSFPSSASPLARQDTYILDTPKKKKRGQIDPFGFLKELESCASGSGSVGVSGGSLRAPSPTRTSQKSLGEGRGDENLLVSGAGEEEEEEEEPDTQDEESMSPRRVLFRKTPIDTISLAHPPPSQISFHLQNKASQPLFSQPPSSSLPHQHQLTNSANANPSSAPWSPPPPLRKTATATASASIATTKRETSFYGTGTASPVRASQATFSPPPPSQRRRLAQLPQSRLDLATVDVDKSLTIRQPLPKKSLVSKGKEKVAPAVESEAASDDEEEMYPTNFHYGFLGSPPMFPTDWEAVAKSEAKAKRKLAKELDEKERLALVRGKGKGSKKRKAEQVEEEESDEEAPKKKKKKKKGEVVMKLLEQEERKEMKERMEKETEKAKGERRKRVRVEIEDVGQEESEEEEEEEEERNLDEGPSQGDKDGKRWIRRMQNKRHAGVEAIRAEKRNASGRGPVVEINPDRNHGETHHYNEVVRNKEQRKKMIADTCDECAAVSFLVSYSQMFDDMFNADMTAWVGLVVRTDGGKHDCYLQRPWERLEGKRSISRDSLEGDGKKGAEQFEASCSAQR